MRFTQVKLARDQLVLFPELLDRAVDVARDVRLVDALEEALQVRGDFRWLVEGRRIDHSSVVPVQELFRHLRQELYTVVVSREEQQNGKEVRASMRLSGLQGGNGSGGDSRSSAAQ